MTREGLLEDLIINVGRTSVIGTEIPIANASINDGNAIGIRYSKSEYDAVFAWVLKNFSTNGDLSLESRVFGLHAAGELLTLVRNDNMCRKSRTASADLVKELTSKNLMPSDSEQHIALALMLLDPNLVTNPINNSTDTIRMSGSARVYMEKVRGSTTIADIHTTFCEKSWVPCNSVALPYETDHRNIHVHPFPGETN